jgi:AcrR family transcriptional regulator
VVAYLVTVTLLSNLVNVTTRQDTSARPPLTTERVLQAAVGLADRQGLGALTMRALGADLGVEAMSLYKHVANKEAILDGVVELIVGQIEIPSQGTPWKQAMRQRAVSARSVLADHAWAIGLLETRGSMGPATMRYLDAILGNLRAAGFTIQNAVHAFWLLDSYVYGHVIQETTLAPGRTSPPPTASTAALLEQAPMAEYPHLVEVAEHAMRSDYSVDGEFRYGLDLILDALERAATPAAG